MRMRMREGERQCLASHRVVTEFEADDMSRDTLRYVRVSQIMQRKIVKEKFKI